MLGGNEAEVIISLLAGAGLVVAFALSAIGKTDRSKKKNQQTTGTDDDNISAGDK